MDSKTTDNKTMDDVLRYLELSYVGARALDDVVAMVKISRAIAAIKAPVSMSIFTNKFEEWYNEHEIHGW